MTSGGEEKLAEIASRAAHDLKNLLAVILGNAELLREAALDDDAQMLDLILDAAQRGAELAEHLARAAASAQDAGRAGPQ